MVGLVSTKSDARKFLLEMLPKNSVAAEIGVHKGAFSIQILRTANPSELHLIDPWKYQDSGTYSSALYGGKAKGRQAEMDERYQAVCGRFETETRSGRVRVHRGFSADILDKFPDSYFDWVYIDANHLYDFVKQDLELSLKKVKPGGYITGDDYTEGGWWRGGVKKAVDEFLREQPVQLVSIRNGQFVLRK